MPQRVLFICSQNMMRSPTAEAVYRHEPDLEVASAGTNEDAVNPVSDEIIAWADTVVVMEGHHRRDLEQRYRSELQSKDVVVLGIPDRFNRMDAELIASLRAKEHLWRGSARGGARSTGERS